MSNNNGEEVEKSLILKLCEGKKLEKFDELKNYNWNCSKVWGEKKWEKISSVLEHALCFSSFRAFFTPPPVSSYKNCSLICFIERFFINESKQAEWSVKKIHFPSLLFLLFSWISWFLWKTTKKPRKFLPNSYSLIFFFSTRIISRSTCHAPHRRRSLMR